MNHIKKIMIATIVSISLIASNSFIYANSNEHHHAATAHTHNTHDNQAESQKTNLNVIIQNNNGVKRNMAMSRVLWSGIKCAIGWSLFTPGVIIAIVSPEVLLTGIGTGKSLLMVSGAVGCLFGFPATYLGYKLIQSSHETYRDELIESAGLK